MGIGLSNSSNPLIGVFGGGAQQAYNPSASALQNNTAMANNAYAQNQSAFQQQQKLMQQYNQARFSEPKDYRFNGRDMDAEEFVNAIFPDDCPEKTYLLLKMKGNENE